MQVSLVTAMILAMASPNSTLQLQEPSTLTTTFKYTATVAEANGDTYLWIPVPSNNALQVVGDILVSSETDPNLDYAINTEPEFGNRMIAVHLPSHQGPLTVTATFTVKRKRPAVLDEKMGLTQGFPSLARCLASDSLVPVGARYAELAREVAGNTLDVMQRMKQIFTHTTEELSYDYQKQSPKLGQGDVAFVCDIKTGNCSDIHSYMISLARSSGIPAFLEYGFPISGIPVPEDLPKEGSIGGYHCWMWYWDAGLGWLPVDASDAIRWNDAKHPEVAQRLFGNLVLHRSAVSISRGRDIQLVPAAKSGRLNYFIYPYAEVNGQKANTDWKMEYRIES
ncbi:MAG: hypothetical protein KatS3mg015_2092 [Fimbriimonadales bacterium]|nr:MAG: hypothetical protein KatS3mg015_2092 [Fimbriimonadales bacterium]